jgi:two-component system OmpR family response regulator
MSAKQILVVEDERPIREMIAFGLRRAGFEVREAADARSGRAEVANKLPDLLLVDWMLPDTSGLEFTRALKRARETRELPVIMLTARAEEIDRILGLEMGADDYLVKPFSPRELLARIKSIRRRTRALPPARSDAHRLRFAGWTLDLAARQLVAADGVVVPLSGAEFRLLTVFVEHPNRVLDRNQLMDLTVGRDGTPYDRSIDVQVSRLRVRLRDDAREPRIIKTVRSEGYVFAALVERLA